MKKYRIRLAFALVASFAALAFYPAFSAMPQISYLPIENADAMYIMQTITTDSKTSRTITWQSETAEVDAVVEYRLPGSDTIATVNAAAKAFTAGERTIYLYTATLQDLQHGALYEYQVGHHNKRTGWHKLNTENGSKFKALIFPDSQSSDYNVWENVAQSAWQDNPDAQFFVNMGDLVDNGAAYSQWRAWLAAARGMIDRIPLVPVQGNHETYTLDWKIQMPETFLHLFNMPGNGNSDHQNQYYSYDFGDVHFVVFNSQFEEMEAFQPGMLEAEMAWLENDLAATNKKWKVVMMHENLFAFQRSIDTDSPTSGFTGLGGMLMPLFDKYNVDAVLTAHMHTYRRRQQLYHFEPNPQGTLYMMTGIAGSVRYPGLWQRHELDIAFAPQPETNNYMTMEADANSLKFEAFLPSGEKFDSVELTK